MARYADGADRAAVKEPYVSVKFWGMIVRTPKKAPKYKFPLPDQLFRGWVNPATGIEPAHLGL